jgi:hypothetical protein
VQPQGVQPGAPGVARPGLQGQGAPGVARPGLQNRPALLQRRPAAPKGKPPPKPTR